MNDLIIQSPVCLFFGAGTSHCLGKDLMYDFVTRLEHETNEMEALKVLSVSAEHDLEGIMSLINTLEQLRPVLVASGVNREFINACIRLRADIERLIVHHYRGTPDQTEKALETHGKFLLRVANENPHSVLPVFTTNYDTIVEAAVCALQEQVKFCDGFDRQPGSPNDWWAPEAYEKIPENVKTIALFKLHGSLDWLHMRDSNAISRQATPTYLGDDPDCRPIMIYPGEKNFTLPWLFGQSQEYLGRLLDRARLLVVVGYSFRDPEITARIRSSLRFNPDLKVMVFDPNPANVRAHLDLELDEQERLIVREGSFEDRNTQMQITLQVAMAARGLPACEE